MAQSDNKSSSPKGSICPNCGSLYGPEEKRCPKDGATLNATSDTLAGKRVGSYVLIRRLGRGGAGMVYLGLQPDIGSRVAIKILSEEAAEDRSQLERFLTEAQAVNKIEHPNIVKILDKGELDDGRPYILMELLDGSSLKERLQEGPELSMKETKELILQLLDALQAAHEAGFIHRDIKPENIHITSDKRAKIVDFGIAKLVDKDRTGLTQTGTILGTPLYIAPEQASGQNDLIGPQTDIYCLGVLLYELYTGTLPFESKNLYKIITSHINEKPPPPSERNSLISKALERVILKCLEKDPADRFQSAAELMEAFITAHEGFAQGLEDTLSEGFQLPAHVSQGLKAIPGRQTTKSEKKEPNPKEREYTGVSSHQTNTWRSVSGQAMSPKQTGESRKKPRPVFNIPAILGIGFAALALLAFGVFLLLRSGNETKENKQKVAVVEPTGSLVILQNKDTESLLPTEVEYTPSINVLSNVFEALVLFEPLTGRIKPWLAEEWTATPKGYVFTLRKGVKFHDGTILKAQQAVESLRRTMKSTMGKTYFWDVEEVNVTAPMRFEIKLSQKSSSFLTRLSLWPAFIHIPKKPYPLGTGPFRIKNRNAQMGAVLLGAFRDYWHKPAKLNELVFRVSSEQSAQSSLLIQGDAHLAADLPPEMAHKLEKRDDIEIYSTATNVTVYMFFNTEKPYLASPEIRKALSKAVDVDKLIKELYKGAARRASGSLPPIMAASRLLKGAGPPRYSPSDVKKALAGKPIAKQTLKIYLPAQSRSSIPNPEKMGRLLVEGLSRAGIRAETVFLSSKDFYEACARGEHDLTVFGWIPDYPDPENVYFLLSKKGKKAGYNLALYENDTYEQLMVSAMTEENNTKRRELFFRMEKIIKDNRPWLPLVYVSAFVGVRKELKGVKLGVEQCLGGADLFLRGAFLEDSK